MEEKKNNKGLVWLIVVLIILVLGLVGYIVYDKVLKDKNIANNNTTTTATKATTTTINVENNKKEDYTNLKTFEVKLNNNTCISLTEKEYYDYEPYMVKVDIIKQNNKTIKYEYISTQELEIEYFNSKKIKEKDNYEPLLTYICNYSNYFLTGEGWEGPANYKIIDNDGNIIHNFTGSFKNNNGILEIVNFIFSSTDDEEIETYKLNLNSNNLEKIDLISKKFNCNDIKNPDEYQYELETDKEIQAYCAY